MYATEKSAIVDGRSDRRENNAEMPSMLHKRNKDVTVTRRNNTHIVRYILY